MTSELRDFGHHAAGLRRFLQTPLTAAGCIERLRQGLAEREQRFLDTVARGVYARPTSPYLPLLQHAGIERGDLTRLVADEGLDGALERLYEAGVTISIEEFRGGRPIERPGLSVPVRHADFDNPLAGPTWAATTGGSRSLGRQVLLNIEHLERGAMYHMMFLIAHRVADHPEAIWRPLAMRTASNNALRSAKRRRPLEKWFSQTRVFERPFRTRDTILTANALLASRLWAAPIPFPEHVPFSEAGRIARWLEEKAASGTPALLGTSAGSAARVCIAAGEHGFDITGTVFRAAGEPLTQARADVISGTGSTVFSDYSMAEVGRVGLACDAPSAVGDVHLMTDKIAVVQRPRVVPTTGEAVGALFVTTLLPSAPKLMINVETDDYGVVEDRDCGCPIGELGFSRHLHGIRSYEKLTSEGVTMRGSDVLALLEETLPTRFGGSPTDYQLVDHADGAVPTLSVLVGPGAGTIDEQEVIEVVLSALAHGDVRSMEVAQIWGGAGTLRVVRREPYGTPSGKVLPIHVLTGREI